MTAAKRRVAVVAAIVLAGLGALALRVVIEGRSALADGDDALANKRPSDAIAGWETAARWYLPGAPHVGEAYDRLLDYARKHRSLVAWRAIRSAALATQSLWTPHADALAEANTAIAELAAADPDGAQRPDRLAWHQARLAAPTRPSKPAAALAILGIVGWLAGIAVLLRRGITPAGAPIRKQAMLGAALTAGGILAWAVGLYSA